jgi:hypothetical protein
MARNDKRKKADPDAPQRASKALFRSTRVRSTWSAPMIFGPR